MSSSAADAGFTADSDPGFGFVPDPASADQRLPLGVLPDGSMTRRAATIGFILGTICVVGAFPLAIVGIVLSNMGMNRVQTAPAKARRLVTWSWWILGVTSGLVLLGVTALLLPG